MAAQAAWRGASARRRALPGLDACKEELHAWAEVSSPWPRGARARRSRPGRTLASSAGHARVGPVIGAVIDVLESATTWTATASASSASSWCADASLAAAGEPWPRSQRAWCSAGSAPPLTLLGCSVPPHKARGGPDGPQGPT